MRPVKVLISAILVLAAPALAQQSVWKWRDANGVVHYSDQPVPGAERVQLRTQTYTPTPVTPAAEPSRGSNSPSTAAEYKTLEVWKPSNEETLTGTGGQVNVAIRVEPAPAPGHSLWLYLDGRRLDPPAPNATEYDLQGIDRGEHTLTAVIVDGKGQQLRSSQRVTFYVQQPSVIKRRS